ncbi:hypothetical protein [Stenotrophomonas sepilia]
MSEITRFSWNGLYGMEELPDGDYVLHSEHEAEVARLRAEVEAYKSLVCGIVYNRHKCFIPTDDPHSSTFNWDERADAAMGASA